MKKSVSKSLLGIGLAFLNVSCIMQNSLPPTDSGPDRNPTKKGKMYYSVTATRVAQKRFSMPVSVYMLQQKQHTRV